MSKWEIIEFARMLKDETISYGIVQPGAHSLINSVPIIRVQNIKDGRITTSDLLKVDASIEEKYKRTRLIGGELLITVVGNVGECAIVPNILKGFNVARAISVARINNEYDTRFVKYAFKTDDVKFQLYGNTNDTVQPTLNLSLLKKLQIKTPLLPEQRAIAEVLSSLDDKIDLLHRNNKTLEEMAEMIFAKEFLTQYDSSLVEEFEITMGQSPPGSSYNEDGHGILFYQGRTDFGYRFPTPRVYCTDPKRFAVKFDTLLSVRAPVGDVNIASERCCIGRGLAAIRHRNCNVHYSYTFHVIKAIRSAFDIHEETGTIFGAIGKEDLFKIKCPRLSTDDIMKFNYQVAPFEEKIFHNEQQIKTITTLRDLLLPKLMSGALRVKDFTHELSEL